MYRIICFVPNKITVYHFIVLVIMYLSLYCTSMISFPFSVSYFSTNIKLPVELNDVRWKFISYSNYSSVVLADLTHVQVTKATVNNGHSKLMLLKTDNVFLPNAK